MLSLIDRHPAATTGILALCAAAALAVWGATTANACGGLFCNSSSPVNQTAERIIFVDNGDDTTTAIIQIMYEGPGDGFAWVLPVADIPNPDQDIRVSSNLALDRLQQRTNPQYQLNTIVEGTCGGGDGRFSASTAGGFAGDGDGDGADDAAGESGVVVIASGAVGPFDYELIEVRNADSNVAQVAIDWLGDNGYDLGGGEELLRPYLQNGLKLLCVRLSAGNTSGSIRPLMITYSGSTPSIPILPTAVAAQDDMGIMVFVGGGARAIPANYSLLELNEALIDWYNPNATYNDVVIRAANEASGHGFVTEYADLSSTLEGVVVQDWERQQFGQFQAQTFTSDSQILEAALQWGQWDGYTDALNTAITALPAGVSEVDVANCPSCYLDGAVEGVVFDRDRFKLELYEQVVRPMFDTDTLITSQKWITRLYTTMSADEMTEDPVFDFNPDMGEVSNLHQADLIIECAPEYEQFEAPFRVEFESGAVVHGTEQGVWPVDLSDEKLPAALRISQASTSGEPVVMVDNIEIIELMLSGNESSPPDDGEGSADGGVGSGSDSSDGLCGCRAVGSSSGGDGNPIWLLALAGIAVWRRNRRSH